MIVGRLIPAGTGNKVKIYKEMAADKDKEIIKLIEKKDAKKTTSKDKVKK